MTTRDAGIDVRFTDQLELHEFEIFSATASVLPTGQVIDLNDATLVSMGGKLTIPFFNRVFCARSTPDRCDALIDRIVQAFARLDLPPHVRTTPATSPPDFGERLLAADFLPKSRDAVMYYAGGPAVAVNPRVRVDQVGSSQRDAFLRVMYAGFDIPAFLWDGFGAIFDARVDNPAFDHYLAHVDARPVGSATRFRSSNNVAGLYTVATLPNYRGQGVATALVARAIADTRARGDVALCLQTIADSDAERLFKRLGFARAYVSVDFIRQG
jgi:GNAT superfamily N-acetyltransferase